MWRPRGSRHRRGSRRHLRRRGQREHDARVEVLGRTVQQVGRIVGERAAAILLGNGAGRHAHPPIGNGDDLLPARAPGEVLVAIAQLVEGAHERRIEIGPVHRAQPHRRQIAGTGDEAHLARGHPQRPGRAVDLQVKSLAEAVGGAPQVRAGRRMRRIGDEAVGLHLLERRDLGHVDDVGDLDPLAADAESGVVVDREVPQRMPLGRRRGERAQGEGGEGCRAPGSHRPSSRASARSACAAWSRSK